MRAFGARLARDELHGPARGLHRTVGIARGATDVGEPVVEQAQVDSVPARVEGADGRLEVGARTRPASDGERRLGGSDLQVRIDRRPAGLPARCGRADRPVRDGQRRLQGGELVRRGVLRGRDGGRLDGRGASEHRVVGSRPQLGQQRRWTGQRRREGDAVPGPRDRQQVALHRPTDRLVAEGDRSIALHDEAVLHSLGEAGPHVGVQDAVAMAWAAGGSGRRAVGLGLVRLGDVRELLRGERQPGRRHQPQDAAALGRARLDAGDDQGVKRVAQRRAGQLAAGGEQFLGDEREATRPFHDQQQETGRRSFALDPFDQGGEVVAIQRLQGQPLERSRGGRDGRQVAGPRIVAGHDVRLIRRDDREPLIAGDARQEPHQGAGRRIGAMEVLEDEGHRLAIAEPPEHAEDGLERPRLPPLRRAGDPLHRFPEPDRQVGQEPDHVEGGRPQDGLERRVVQRAQGRPDGPDHRGIGVVGTTRPGAPAQDRPRLREFGDARDAFVEESADAHARGPAQDERS